MRNNSAANFAASAPPAPARTSKTTSLESSGSFGTVGVSISSLSQVKRRFVTRSIQIPNPSALRFLILIIFSDELLENIDFFQRIFILFGTTTPTISTRRRFYSRCSRWHQNNFNCSSSFSIGKLVDDSDDDAGRLIRSSVSKIFRSSARHAQHSSSKHRR